MNERKLKAKLVELGMNYEHCANALNMSTNTFTKKINNVEKFTVLEANKFAKILGLSNEEKLNIFLN